MLRSRLFWKLLGGFAAVIALGSAVVGAVAWNGIRRDAIREIEDSLMTRARFLSVLALPVLQGQGDWESFQETLKRLGAVTNTRLTIIAPDGSPLADSLENPAHMDNHLSRPEVRQALLEGIGVSERFSATVNTAMKYCAIRIEHGGEVLGFARAAAHMVLVSRQLARSRNSVLLGALTAAACAMGLALVAARAYARPVREMTAMAQSIASGRFDRLVHSAGRDEIADLAEALNAMSFQLQERIGALAKERNELRAILAGMAEGVVAIDTADRLLHLNELAAEIMGADARTAPGRPIWEVARVSGIADALADAKSGKAQRKREIAIPREEGDRIIELNASPLRGIDDEIVGGVLVIRDVTELRRLEAMRKDFIANVSHELKTPLTAIRGLVETVIDDERMDAETQKRFLIKARNQTDRLAALVSDLLNLGRLESDAASMEKHPFDLRKSVEESLSGMKTLAAEAEVCLKMEAPDSPVMVLGDEEAIRVVVDNLLSNAIRYTPKGGLASVRVSDTPDGPLLEVSDTGIGIAPKHQSRIFERFYRVDKARSRELGGTGLGLSIVKHIVNAHGGQLALQSALGQGSVFTARFPKAG